MAKQRGGLPRLQYGPHPWQENALNLLGARQGQRTMVTAPTGTGKSFMMLLKHLPTRGVGWVLTPKVEIIRDMLAKMSYDTKDMSESEIVKLGMELKITTPMRMLNMLKKGEIDTDSIEYVVKDEAHHDEAETYSMLDVMLPESIWQIGFTATYYRGTPKSTAALHAKWGDPLVALTYPEAVVGGFISMPSCEVWPLVDDDVFTVSTGGEFNISQVQAAVTSKLDHVFQLLLGSKIMRVDKAGKRVPTQPTIIGLPSRELFASMREMAEKYQLPIGFVDAETPFSVRTQLFNMALACKITLCHVNVVSEGLDIGNQFKHLRNYIDLSPVNSGLLFMQRFGRITRPLKEGETRGQYICTNRNLERHGYLLEGILPMASMVGAQAAFPNVSDRAAVRLVGLSSLGRLKPTTIKMMDGCTVYMFNITCMQGAKKQEFVAVLHPTKAETLWFEKTSTVTGMVDGKRQMNWGRWQRTTAPSHDLKGFNSAPPSVLTTKQVELWQKHAERLGIEPTQKVNGKNFQLVPLLLNVTRSRT